MGGEGRGAYDGLDDVVDVLQVDFEPFAGVVAFDALRGEQVVDAQLVMACVLVGGDYLNGEEKGPY